VPIEQLWIQPELDVREYRILYIAPVQIDPLAYRNKGEKDHQSAQRLAEAFRQELLCELQGAGIFEFVSTDPYFATVRNQALTLETRISEIDSGNAKRRVWIGFGAGATRIQIEGKLWEHKQCRTLVEFADCRTHGGGTLIWGAKKAADPEYLMGIDMRGILRGITKLFIFLREEGAPQDQR
jgi:hypothetical protein